MLQALAEFHFFRPDHLNSSKWSKPHQWNKAKEEFRKFWEGGIQRIGENDAEGWLRDQDEDIKNEHDWKERQQQWKDNECKSFKIYF